MKPPYNEEPIIQFDIDRIIHEPSRLLIMALLYVVESADFLFIMRQTKLTFGNLSSHISTLETANYVEVEKDFQNKKPHTTIKLTNMGREAFQSYQKNLKQVFANIPD